MASFGVDIGLNCDIKELSDELERQRQKLRTMNMAFNGNPYQTTSNKAYIYADDDEDGPATRFDPEEVNWKELMKLYQDDPLLMAIFEGMREYVGEEQAPAYTFPLPPAPSAPGTVTSIGSSTAGGYLSGLQLSGTSTTGTWAGGITSSTGTVSTPFTLTYKADGSATLIADSSSAPGDGSVSIKYENE